MIQMAYIPTTTTAQMLQDGVPVLRYVRILLDQIGVILILLDLRLDQSWRLGDCGFICFHGS